MEAFPRLGRRPLGGTGIMVSPLALSAWSVRAAGPPAPGLAGEDVAGVLEGPLDPGRL